MSPLLQRFLRYVRIDTQSDESSRTVPSTDKQLLLSRLLARECAELGLQDVTLEETGVVMATVPANVPHAAPVIAWIAHVDTSPEYTARGVNPIVHEHYDGTDLVLPGDPSWVLRAADNSDLARLIGTTIVTTDGTTLLGADDKAGIAEIMSAAEFLMTHPEIPHGPVRVCFTCDEEIGRGIEHVDLQKLGAVCGYTLDGGGRGTIDVETFSADLAVVTVTGVNTHPSEGKGRMVNAVRILAEFLRRLPSDRLSPETTSGREGFLHPYQISGGVAEAKAHIILRDFETARLREQAVLLEAIAEELRREHLRASIRIDIRKQYRNLADGLNREPRAVAHAVAAMKAVGVEPRMSVIRGGTDGSLLTERGLPTPNLASGQHNPHCPLEWASLDEMQTAVHVLVQLAVLWGRERA